ncbi:hypothetical protein [Haloterrigena salinisoli]|uniref:hypothetical protein n=1 Tax=Haloterrigena salinisoli TaxID=3132747 RepID=UPI0030D01C88
MGNRTDAALAILVLAAVGIAFVAVGASVSWPAAAVGGLGTIGFELVAARAYETVRRYWERPLVRGLSLTAALLVVAVGAAAAPDVVLSLFCGGAVTYLAFLALVEAGLVPTPETWW